MALKHREGKHVKSLLFLLSGLLAGMLLLGAGVRMSAKVEDAQPISAASRAGSPTSLTGTHRFIAFGDWGAGTPFQKNVARQATQLRRAWPFPDALLLGDNFYPDGDVAKYGKPYFTDMYASLIREGVCFIVALGNHDMLHAKEQIAFFRMPGPYYMIQRPLVTFFVIDSNTFANDPAQREWLDRAMEGSKARWKIVLGHHPIYSSGKHGGSLPLRTALEPILNRRGADLYLAGHDHDYERFKPIHGVIYIVSGGGGAYLRDFPNIAAGSLVRLQTHHFLTFEAGRNRLAMRAIDAQGKLIDHAEYHKGVSRPGTPLAKKTGQ